MIITVVVLKIVIAYLLGSLSGSLLVGRLRGVDVRKLGSGNAGGTNALRTQGWRFALAVVLIDIGKGALAVWIAQRGVAAPLSQLQIGLLAAAAAVCGHVWPLFFGFRGGKGAATLVGGLLLLWPFVLLPLIGVWLLVVVCSGYVGLATMLAGLALIPTAALWALPPERMTWLLASVLIAVFLIFTHRENVQRLLQRREHRFERVRVIGRWLERHR